MDAVVRRKVIGLRARRDGPQAFRWVLAGPRRPPLTLALQVGEAARATVYKAADARGLLPLPDTFHAGDDPSHSHAFWFSEDADGDGLIDHVLLFAESGLPPALVPVLAEGGSLWLARKGAWQLVPDWMGRRAPGVLFGPARHWITSTPYVTPRRRFRGRGGKPRSKDAVENQLANEIVWRGLPPPAEIAFGRDLVCGPQAVPAHGFALATGSRAALPDAAVVGARISFEEPVWGPLGLGFGCHFGLGLFAPADEFIEAGVLRS